MNAALLCLTLCWAAPAAPEAARPAIEIKPTAINLDAPPEAAVQRSCVLRRADLKPMKIVSATAGDPAISLTWREHPAAGTHVVTAILPAGYAPAGGKTEIVITTDVKDVPPIRVPIYVYSGVDRNGETWLKAAKALIGKPAPAMRISRIGGGELVIGSRLTAEQHARLAAHRPGRRSAISDQPSADSSSVDPGLSPEPRALKPEPSQGGQDARHPEALSPMTVLAFWAAWCEHCDVYMPILENIRRDYAGTDMEFIAIAAESGTGEGIRQAMARWDLTWEPGLDRGLRAIRVYGVQAFPCVFVIGRDGIVEAVHGRNRNAPRKNGLDNLESDLRTELDLLLAGCTREQFPANQTPATQPATALRPAIGTPTEGQSRYVPTTRPASS